MTLTLRPGVKFADGSPLTAGDVKWPLDRARDPKAGAWSSPLASIDGIEASGGAVKIALRHPDPTIIPALATFNAAILPQKLFESAPGAAPEDKARALLAGELRPWVRDLLLALSGNADEACNLATI